MPDGGVEEVCDPANPLRAPGAFGDKSVLEFAGYRPPAWLAAPVLPGWRPRPGRAVALPAGRGRRTGLGPGGRRPGRAAAVAGRPRRPEYAALSGLTTYAAALTAAGRLARHRVALLGPGNRDEWYSATSATRRRWRWPCCRRSGAGSRSPGRWSAWAPAWGRWPRCTPSAGIPGLFGGLFLQSGSFFTRRLDPQERGFGRYARITAVRRRDRRGTTLRPSRCRRR